MLNRVTIRAQHFKIVNIVIFAITIFVMHSKYVRHFVIPATLANGQQPSCGHFFTYSSKRRFPLIFGSFVNTCFRAIFSFVRWSVQKFNLAVRAGILCSAFARHCFAIAQRRAIFGFVCSAGYVCKRHAAFLACRNQLHSASKCKTLAATVQRSIFTIRRDRKQDLALHASLIVPDSGAFYATH